MTENPDLDERSQKVEPRERAVSAFLDLGDKLKSVYLGENRESPRFQFAAEGAETLFSVIEGEIIPRLMLVHKGRDGSDQPVLEHDVMLTSEDHGRFLETVVTESAAATRRFLEALLRRGVTQETVFLELLTKAARRLGELWDEDLCDFSDVTIGLCRLHQVLREQSLLHEVDGERTAVDAPRILLTTACGDQHVFGVLMVAEFFRRAGWHVWSEPGTSRAQLASILATEDFDVLGLSVACSALVDDVANEIETFRKASQNPELKVLVGGRLFVDTPDLVAGTGADGVAFDAKHAPIAGRELLARP